MGTKSTKSNKPVDLRRNKRGAKWNLLQQKMREPRLEKVAELFLKEIPQYKIAEQLNVSPKTIHLDLKLLEERWRLNGNRTYDDAKAKELEKWNRLEYESWQGWERSQKEMTVKRIVQRAMRKAEDEGDEKVMTIIGKISEKLQKGSAGNPAFLAQIERCIIERSKLLGLLRTPDINMTNTVNVGVGVPNWDDLLKSPEQPNVIEEKLAPVRAMIPVHVETTKEKKDQK